MQSGVDRQRQTTSTMTTMMTAAETLVEAVAMGTVEAGSMVAVMAAANAMAAAAMMVVVVAMATAHDGCIEGNCVGNVAWVAAASTMAVKAVAR